MHVVPFFWKDHLAGPFAGRGFGGGYDEAIADDTALALDDYVALLVTEDVTARSSFCWYTSCSTIPWYACRAFFHPHYQPHYKHSPTCTTYSHVQGHLGIFNSELGILIFSDASSILGTTVVSRHLRARFILCSR